MDKQEMMVELKKRLSADDYALLKEIDNTPEDELLRFAKEEWLKADIQEFKELGDMMLYYRKQKDIVKAPAFFLKGILDGLKRERDMVRDRITRLRDELGK